MKKAKGLLAVAMLSGLVMVGQEVGVAPGGGAAAEGGAQVAQPAVVQPAEPSTSVEKTKEEVKKELARLRGKLLYKKGQVRKLEKAVLAGDASLATKAAEMERQRREMYVAAESKLASLYEEQDALELQVKNATESSKL